MDGPWILLPAAVAAAVALWALGRRAAARRAACRRRFSESLEAARPEISLDPAADGGWRLVAGGRELASVDGAALTRAAARAGDDSRRLFLAVADAARHGPRPLAGELDLKRHGPRLLPRLADEGLGLLELDPLPARHAAAGAPGLPTIYVVDGESPPAYLGDDHLDRAGIDTRDVHGVALAVLRQRFDETAVREALEPGGLVRVEPADGCGGSRLLLLPEALAPGETLFAATPSPGLLLAAGDRQRLERALDDLGETTLPLPPAIYRVTAAGAIKES